MDTASHRKQLLTAVLLTATAIGIAVAVIKFREMKGVATATANNIEAELDALDPVTRAAALGKLAKDATTHAKA